MKIVQIGSNSGNDSVFQFITKNIADIDYVVLVEPIPFVLPMLRECYKSVNNTHIEQVAIADTDEDMMSFYYEHNSINYEVSALSKKHLIDHGCDPDKIVEIKVPTMTINKLFDKHNIQELDYLFIDAEGLDVHLVASIDFSKYKVKNILFESAHTDGVRTRGSNYNSIVNYLSQLGYIVQNIDGLNTKATLL